jgi:hypothetical protein
MSLLEIQRDYTFDAERGLKVRSVMQKSPAIHDRRA